MKHLYWVNVFPPEFRSVGDHAQTVAAQHLLDEQFSDYKIHRYYRTEINRFLQQKVASDDLIFIHSSGDFGDLYNYGHVMRKQVINAHPNCRIVQLPVNVYYSTWKAAVQDTELFRQHQNVLVMCRTLQETAYLKLLGCNAVFMPDTTYSLPTPQKRGCNDNGKTLFVIRSDSESLFKGTFVKVLGLLQTPLKFLGRALHKDVFFVARRLSRYFDSLVMKWKIQGLCKDADVFDPQIAGCSLTDDIRESHVQRVLQLYSNYRCVVTDRFHAALFAKVAGVPVKVLPSRIRGKQRFYNVESCREQLKTIREKTFSFPVCEACLC